MAAEEPSYLGTELDLFARKTEQDSCLETTEVLYKPSASVDQTDIEFLVPGVSETYIDVNLKLFIRGEIIKRDGTELVESDYTAGVNNLLHSLFSQSTISLNGTQITQASQLYCYREYLETLLTYGTDPAESHLRMAFWELYGGNFKAGDCSKPAEFSNAGFCARWNHTKNSQGVQMYCRIHADICSVTLLLNSGVKNQIKLTKAKSSFYLLTTKENGKVYFKIQEALLYAKRIKPCPSVLTGHTVTRLAGYPITYNLTRVELKTFTFSSGSQSLSIDDADWPASRNA